MSLTIWSFCSTLRAISAPTEVDITRSQRDGCCIFPRPPWLGSRRKSRASHVSPRQRSLLRSSPIAEGFHLVARREQRTAAAASGMWTCILTTSLSTSPTSGLRGVSIKPNDNPLIPSVMHDVHQGGERQHIVRQTTTLQRSVRIPCYLFTCAAPEREPICFSPEVVQAYQHAVRHCYLLFLPSPPFVDLGNAARNQWVPRPTHRLSPTISG